MEEKANASSLRGLLALGYETTKRHREEIEKMAEREPFELVDLIGCDSREFDDIGEILKEAEALSECEEATGAEIWEIVQIMEALNMYYLEKSETDDYETPEDSDEGEPQEGETDEVEEGKPEPIDALNPPDEGGDP